MTRQQKIDLLTAISKGKASLRALMGNAGTVPRIVIQSFDGSFFYDGVSYPEHILLAKGFRLLYIPTGYERS
ncbi:MAG: hypothetical protein C5B59_01845 [Bacteroidetes bacterium]|nr:MAG: hypothetical protein C5B59_01845 [Bacteroidota bacterium]